MWRYGRVLFADPEGYHSIHLISYQWPRGQLYLGMIVMPIPKNPVEFLQQIVLPQQRAETRNLRLLEHEDLPTWVSSVAAANTAAVLRPTITL